MNGMKTFFFMTLMTVLTVAVGSAFDAYFHGRGSIVMMFFLFSLAMNIGTYWFADTVILRMHGAREVAPEEAPRLHAIVDRLVARAGLPKPKVCIVPGPIPNAFATGRNWNHSAVAVTEGLLQTLDEDELEGVLSHELAHVRHYDMLLGTVVASMAGLISMLAHQAQWGLLLGGGRRDREGNNPLALIGLLLTIFIAPLIAILVRNLISHQREFAADEGGAEISGKPLALASALRKIEAQAARAIRFTGAPMGAPGTAHLYFINHFSLGEAARSFMSTHPATDERIERLLAINERMTGRARR